MNVTINSQALATELRLLNKIVPTKPAIAILSHALFTATDEGLTLWATDLEVGFRTTCQAQVGLPGIVALPVARFLSLVEQFQDGDVTIEHDGKQVQVTCGAFRSKLQAMPASDFPPQPKADGEQCTLDAGGLQGLIARTRYAVSSTASKAILKGALLVLAGEAAAMVSTDGKRLVLATMSRTGSDQRIVIPAKALDALAGQAAAGDVGLTVGKRHLHFTLGDRTLVTRTIDGTFPEYQRIIPASNDVEVSVSRAALTAALRRIVLVSEDNKATFFSFDAGALEVSSRSAEVGSAAEEVAIEYAGKPLKLCVNGTFVLDFLDAAAGSDVTLKLKDNKTPMMMMDGVDCIGVIMLMKG